MFLVTPYHRHMFMYHNVCMPFGWLSHEILWVMIDTPITAASLGESRLLSD